MLASPTPSPEQGLVVVSSGQQQQRRKLVQQVTQGSWIQLAGYGEDDVETVALSSDGTVLAVGNSGGDGSGVVRVFKYDDSESNNNKLTQLGSDIVSEAVNDVFSVSLSGDGTVLAVGRKIYTYNGDGSISAIIGYVRVYTYDDADANSEWTQRGADINGEASSVDLSSDGTIVAVGASDNGHVRVYKYANKAWTQMGADIDGEAAGDRSGKAVSLSSDGAFLAVGAPKNHGINGPESGHVRVYKYANSKWTQLGADIDGEAAYDYSGFSVSLSSNRERVLRLAVGAYNNSGSVPDSYSGHVRVYQFANNAWTQLGADIDGEAAGDRSGWSVSLSGDGTVLAVGAPMNPGDARGHVRVYKYADRNSNKWTQMGADIDGAAGDRFGSAVALSSDGTVLAGMLQGMGIQGLGVRMYTFTAPFYTPQPTSTNEPSSNKPSNRPSSNEPTTGKPTSRSPTTKPSTKKPTNEPSSNKPSNMPSSNKPATGKPTSRSPTTKPRSPTTKPSTKKPTNKPT